MNGIQSLEIASVAVTFFTGVALIAFAYLTYRHTKKVTEIQFSPMLDIVPIKYPVVGDFEETANIYRGVKWEVCFTNPGSIPILAKDIALSIERALYVNAGSRDLHDEYDLVDEEGKTLSREAIGIDGLSQVRIKIYLCRKIEWYRLRFKPGDEVIFTLSVSQTRGVNSTSELKIVQKSEMFRMPKSLKVTPQFQF